MTKRILLLALLAPAVLLAGTARAAQQTRGDTAHPRGAFLVGKRVAVDVGSVVELPPETVEEDRRAGRDVAIGDTRFTEMSVKGQETPVLMPAPNSQVEGDLVAADADILKVRLRGGSRIVTIPRPAITSLQVWQRHSQANKGALVGGGIGLGLGIICAVLGESSYNASESEGSRGMTNALAAASVVVLGTGGFLLGTIAGATTHTERWERIEPQRLNFAVIPDPHGGIRGRLAVRF